MYEAQDGRCAICGSAEVKQGNSKYFHVDHDHETGAVRSLLCAMCNKGLGCFEDNPLLLQQARDYLLVNLIAVAEAEGTS